MRNKTSDRALPVCERRRAPSAPKMSLARRAKGSPVLGELPRPQGAGGGGGRRRAPDCSQDIAPKRAASTDRVSDNPRLCA